MLDPARCVEKISYYQRMIAFCAAWGYNTLLLHLTDDQGSAFHFRRYPEFSSPQALDAEEWQGLVTFAERHGVELIPEVEALGHTAYITRSRRFAHLDDAPDTPDEYSGMCPLEPETLDVLTHLFVEVTRVFPSRWLHVGCDEVVLGKHPTTQRALVQTPLWRIYAEHVQRLQQVVSGLGRRMIIWGDHVISEPCIASALSRDITVHDWAYWPDPKPEHITATVRQGFPTIAGPALVWAGAALRPAQRNLDNVAEMARRSRASGALGTIVTVWVPTRFPPEILWPSVALAGALVRGDDPLEAQDEFIRRYWQADPSDEWREALHLSYHIGPRPEELAALFPVTPQEWQRAAEGLVACRRWQPSLDRALRLFRHCARQTQDNRSALRTLVFSLELQRYGLWRAEQLVRSLEKPDLPVPAGLAARDERMHRRLQAEWRRGREAHNIQRYVSAPAWAMADNLFGRISLAAELSRRWEESSAAFRRDMDTASCPSMSARCPVSY
jgi:hypothetical protein